MRYYQICDNVMTQACNVVLFFFLSWNMKNCHDFLVLTVIRSIKKTQSDINVFQHARKSFL